MRGTIRNAALITLLWSSCAVAADVAVPAAPADEPWQGVINAEARYISWHSSGGKPGLVPGLFLGGGTGQQLYLPVGLQFGGRIAQDFKVEFLVRGGEIHERGQWCVTEFGCPAYGNLFFPEQFQSEQSRRLLGKVGFVKICRQ